MSPLRTILSALQSVGANKLRSLLTLLGVVIGVASVIALMSIGRGVTESVTSFLEGLNPNVLQVWSDGPEGLTLADAYALLDPVMAPSIDAVAPESSSFDVISVVDGFGARSTSGQIRGITPESQIVNGYTIHVGDFIAVPHIANSADVAVLDSRMSERLFSGRNPIGETIKVGKWQMTVIGVLEEQGGGDFFGFGEASVLVPITTLNSRFGGGGRSLTGEPFVSSIGVLIGDLENVERGEDEIRRVLRLRHRVTSDRDRFEIFNQQAELEDIQGAIFALTLFLGSVASISLLVGGIGIMNIMLVSVTERTREIGIRKAIGARRRDILMQFVTESIVLSLVGGIIGVLIGMGVAQLMNITIFASEEDLMTVVSGDITALALGVAMLTGLVFGIYPALRASLLHPIEALRYE